MNKSTRALSIAGCAVALLYSAAAHASTPTGLWIDHTGRGGIEITECGKALCGKLVWLKDTRHKAACGTQILGNVKPVGKDTWDNGWIYDPEDKSKYSVELKLVAPDKLRVTGYMGSKLLSETMHWRRATGELPRCDAPAAAAPAIPSAPAKAESQETRSAANEPEPTPDPGSQAVPSAAPPAPEVKPEAGAQAPAPAAPSAKPQVAQSDDEPGASEPEPRTRTKNWEDEIGKELGKYVSRSGKNCKVTTPFFSATFRCPE
jgi:uncharacterized protein (DUF2147 family)